MSLRLFGVALFYGHFAQIPRNDTAGHTNNNSMTKQICDPVHEFRINEQLSNPNAQTEWLSKYVLCGKTVLENFRQIFGIKSGIGLHCASVINDTVSLMPMTTSGEVTMTSGVNQVDMMDAWSAGPKNKIARNLRVNSEVSNERHSW